MWSRRVLAAIPAIVGCSSSPANSGGGKWEVVAESQPAALLSVWAGSRNNVWVVGGYSGTDGPLVEHYDGTNWTKLATGLGNINLWWVRGFDDGTVWISGSQGTIVSTTDGSSFTPVGPTLGNVIVFGLWGNKPNDVWAVGGNGPSGAFATHYDGSTWTPATLDPGITTVWKVNGFASDDVWMSGTDGWTCHWTGTLGCAQIPDAVQQQNSLFSIGVNSTRVITVGGPEPGVLFESDGTGTWTSPLSSLPALAGVAVTETDAYAVGDAGTMLHRSSSGAWSSETPLTNVGLHAVYIDPGGDVWSVGGLYNMTPTMDGVVLHKGAALKGSFQ
jgi:hypothetical protein